MKKALSANWALNRIASKLPFCSKFPCGCSADVVYYIEEIRKEIRLKQSKQPKKSKEKL